jgi:glycosyltransferase involved in cell wall biosynthesis
MCRALTTAIVIPVHNAREYIERTLRGMEIRGEATNPLVIVDDCSGDETATLLREHEQAIRAGSFEAAWPRKFALLRNERQQLFTRTVNRGLRYAYHHWKPDYIAVVNSDCALKPWWLHNLADALSRDETLGLIGYTDNPDGKKPLVKKVRYPEYVTGHCLLLRVKMLEEVGVFCETDTDGRKSPELAHLKGLAHIGSDRIMSWSANAAGWGTAYCNFEGLTHAAGKSWNHDLGWLSQFDLQPLWTPCDTLEEPAWITT